MDGVLASSSATERALHTMTGLRVLIVEDELIIALGAEMALTENGHEVLGTATTEDEAVEMALATHPDVILLDLRLANGGCGRRVAERVLASIEVAIVFASGNLTPDMQARLAALHPAAMIGKPYFDAQLLKAVNGAAP